MVQRDADGNDSQEDIWTTCSPRDNLEIFKNIEELEEGGDGPDDFYCQGGLLSWLGVPIL